MANMIYDVLLLITFLITFKVYDIYVATVVLIVGSTLQVIGTRLINKRFDNKQVITLVVLLLFGSMTLYFHNPIFIKWKPTIVFWILGIVLLVNQISNSKPLIYRLIGHIFTDKQEIPSAVWQRLNLAWSLFFIILGAGNLFAAYILSTENWVNFKVYGVLAATLLFGIGQSIYLSRFVASR